MNLFNYLSCKKTDVLMAVMVIISIDSIYAIMEAERNHLLDKLENEAIETRSRLASYLSNLSLFNHSVQIFKIIHTQSMINLIINSCYTISGCGNIYIISLIDDHLVVAEINDNGTVMFARIIGEMSPDINIILLTGFWAFNDGKEYKDIDQIFNEPITLDELRKALKKIENYN